VSSRKRLKKSLIEDVVGESDEEAEYGENNARGGAEDSEFDEAEFEDGLGVDLMGDEADRARLSAMTEKEREAILFERGERRQELQDRKEAKLAARAAAGKSSKQSKPTTRGSRSAAKSEKQQKNAALADLLARKHGKVRGKISDSIDYEEEDEEDEFYDEDEEEPSRRMKKNKAKQRKQRAAARAAADQEFYDEESAGSEEERLLDENGELLEPTTRSPLRLQDVVNLQLRRDGVERIFEEPYFNDFAVGMFARVSVGQRDDGSVAYRLCQVVEVTEFKSKYKLGNKETKVAFKLAHGKAERIFQLTQLSNHSLSEGEFKRWLDTMSADNMPTLSMEEAIVKNKKALQLKESFTYTPEIMAKIIEERKAKGLLKSSNLASEKIRLRYALETALQKQNSEEATAIQRRIEELEEQDKRVVSKKSQQTSTWGIHEINKKNRESDVKQLEEMIKQEKIEKKKNIGKEDKPDAFKRRATRPQMSFGDEEEHENKVEAAPQQVKAESKAEALDLTKEEHKTGNTAMEEDNNIHHELDAALAAINNHTNSTHQAIIPPSKVNPNLLPPRLVDFPRLDFTAPNRILFQQLHRCPLNIDINQTQGKARAPEKGRINQWNVLPQGYSAVSLEEYWKRRDEEEMEQ
jgi:RNA polymerase-associated protein RTF1